MGQGMMTKKKGGQIIRTKAYLKPSFERKERLVLEWFFYQSFVLTSHFCRELISL